MQSLNLRHIYKRLSSFFSHFRISKNDNKALKNSKKFKRSTIKTKFEADFVTVDKLAKKGHTK
jgi:hypothetical protein